MSGSSDSPRQQAAGLTPRLPECPPTIWAAELPFTAPSTSSASEPRVLDADELRKEINEAGSEAEWLSKQRSLFQQQLQEFGALWFRNFLLPVDTSGFRAFYEALALNPCLDPTHPSGLRKMVAENDAVYEAANRPELSQHFVALHNEATVLRTPPYGAFVCFQPASEGGEFILADGAKIVQDLQQPLLRQLCERKVRMSLVNVKCSWIGWLPTEALRSLTAKLIKSSLLKLLAPLFDMDIEVVYGADESEPYRFYAVERAQTPVNAHPVTGQLVWFCNLHNHSRLVLNKPRSVNYGDLHGIPEDMAMTDVFYGDLERMPAEEVQHINDVCDRNMRFIQMKAGDVLLVDNYRMQHGRNTFRGERQHLVTWFGTWGQVGAP